MKTIYFQRWIGLFFAFLLLAAQMVPATDCSTAPTGSLGGAWWAAYSSWCQSCGGTPYQNSSGGGCNPGPNWGGGSVSSGGGSSGGSSQDAMLNAVSNNLNAAAYNLGAAFGRWLFSGPSGPSPAEIQAQKDAQEKKRLEEEAAEAEKKRQEEFKYQKLKASLKGVNHAGGLRLKTGADNLRQYDDWESYKVAVLAYQRDLTRQDPKHHLREDWCKVHRPMHPATSNGDYDYEEWEHFCNPDGFVRHADPEAPAPTVGGLHLKLSNPAPAPVAGNPAGGNVNNPVVGGLHLKMGSN